MLSLACLFFLPFVGGSGEYVHLGGVRYTLAVQGAVRAKHCLVSISPTLSSLSVSTYQGNGAWQPLSAHIPEHC